MSRQKAEILFTQFLRECGLDPSADPHLHDTPVRFTKMLCEQTRHYGKTPSFTESATYDGTKQIKATLFDAKGTDELVLVKDIAFSSICAHHLSPFMGRAHVGYLPDKKIIGISKLARIVDYFCLRTQTQEMLTEEIATCLLTITKARFVGIVMFAEHTCMSCRGVHKSGATTVTSKFLPPNQTDTKQEFLKLALA